MRPRRRCSRWAPSTASSRSISSSSACSPTRRARPPRRRSITTRPCSSPMSRPSAWWRSWPISISARARRKRPSPSTTASIRAIRNNLLTQSLRKAAESGGEDGADRRHLPRRHGGSALPALRPAADRSLQRRRSAAGPHGALCARRRPDLSGPAGRHPGRREPDRRRSGRLSSGAARCALWLAGRGQGRRGAAPARPRRRGGGLSEEAGRDPDRPVGGRDRARRHAARHQAVRRCGQGL